jgi:RHS repeat-associated protein
LVHRDTTGQLASYSYSLAANGQRVILDEEIKLTGGSTETHDITYGYDNINRLTDETAESGDYGYDVYYEYDLVGNRTLRQITVNSQPFTTEYEYYDGTDKLKTEAQCGASCMLDIGDERYYAYAKQDGKGFYYRDSSGNKIGSLYAFMIGMPSIWSRYLFILVMTMVPFLLFGPAVLRLLLCYGEPTRLRLRVPRKSICILLAFLIFVGPDGFESLAQAEMQYANLGISSWGQADRTIEYTYDDNGSMLTKTTKVTSTSEVIETVTNHYNLANRLDKVTTELANGDQHIVEYTYNDEGIRVRAYSYDIPNSQGVQNEKTVVYLVDSYNHTGYAQTLEELVFDYAASYPLTETPDSLTTYLIGDDCLAQTVDGTTQYLLYDGHGSTRQLAEYDSGTDTISIADSFSYDAYGVLLQDQADIVKPGYIQQQQTNLLYTGEYFDTDVQQYYLRARWYNQLNGIFNRIDPYSGNNYDPISLHKYLYCRANPVNSIDPNGKFSIAEISIGIGIVSVLTGLVSGVVSKVTGGSFYTGFILGMVSMAVGLTLATFGVPAPAAWGLGSAVAQLIIEIATGKLKENWEAAAMRIAFVGIFASLTTFWIGLKFDFLSVNAEQLGYLLAGLQLKGFAAELGRELGRTFAKGVFFGGMSRIMMGITELFEKIGKKMETLSYEEKRDIRRMYGI